MQFNFKNFPLSDLPYTDVQLCKQMMLRLYEQLPFLPELSLINSNEDYISRTIVNIPGITCDNKKILIPEPNSTLLSKSCSIIENDFNSKNISDLDKYSFDAEYMFLYSEMLKRIQPKYTVIKFLGAFSLADFIFNNNTIFLLSNRIYRKYIAQAIVLKVLWFINKVKEFSPNTVPIIIFDEPNLYKYGTYKRIDTNFTKETITTLFTRIFEIIHDAGALVGVQSFEKCNWQIVLDSNVDILSFNAYINFANLSIVSDKVNNFLKNGGTLNWAIVPANSETVVKNIKVDDLYKKFNSNVKSLSASGIPIDLIYNNSTVSVIGNLSHLPILFAEKALMSVNHLSKKIPSIKH